jgi:hypothetical protein
LTMHATVNIPPAIKGNGISAAGFPLTTTSH